MENAFFGREDLMADMLALWHKCVPSFVTCRGRRRIGKSTLIERFAMRSGARFIKHKRNLPGGKVELLKPGIYTLAVSVGRRDGKPEIALPLEGGIDRIYPVGKIEVK